MQMNSKLIAQGAEAKLFRKGDVLYKKRISKSYRIKKIDDMLRKSRTRREAKILEKLNLLLFPCPKLIKTDRLETIEMEFIEGPKIRDILEKSDYCSISAEIGERIAFLHNHEIIHGDLTTSNMIFKDKVYFIDFGLSFFSKRYEDKAVDIHLFRQAIESKHHAIWQEAFESFINSYKSHAKECKLILKRFEMVETRGRNKLK